MIYHNINNDCHYYYCSRLVFVNWDEARQTDRCPSFGAAPRESRGCVSRASSVDPGSWVLLCLPITSFYDGPAALPQLTAAGLLPVSARLGRPPNQQVKKKKSPFFFFTAIISWSDGLLPGLSSLCNKRRARVQAEGGMAGFCWEMQDLRSRVMRLSLHALCASCRHFFFFFVGCRWSRSGSGGGGWASPVSVITICTVSLRFGSSQHQLPAFLIALNRQTSKFNLQLKGSLRSHCDSARNQRERNLLKTEKGKLAPSFQLQCWKNKEPLSKSIDCCNPQSTTPAWTRTTGSQ